MRNTKRASAKKWRVILLVRNSYHAQCSGEIVIDAPEAEDIKFLSPSFLSTHSSTSIHNAQRLLLIKQYSNGGVTDLIILLLPLLQLQIRYGNCTDAFVFDESAKTVVIRRHQPGDTSAKSTFVGGTVRGDQLFDAHDVALLKVQGERNCLLKLTSGIFRASFVYDLRTAERKFKLHKPGDLCPDGREVRGREDSSQALRDYFGQLKFDKVIAYPQDPEPLDRKRAKKLLSHVEKVDTESDSSNRYDALLTFLAPTMNIEFRYFGDLDTDGRFSGYAVLLVNAKQSCYRGICAVPDISRISGHFVHGILQGPVAITSGNGQATTAAVAVDGILHSLTLTMGLKLLYPHKRVEGKGKRNGVYNFNSRGVGLVTRLVGGQPKGKSWLGMVGMSESGMGFLYGELDLNRHMTGDDVAYVYPWYESALVGRFEENFMKEAKYAHVTSASCNNNLIKAEFTIQDEETTYSYDPPVQGRVSSEPLLRDPYEAENVEVRLSNIAGADDGLFTLRKLRKGQLVALYCGEHFGTDPDDTTYYRDVCAAAASTKNPCEKYSIRTHVGTTILLTDVSGYRATLAWKINNDFPPRIHTEFHDVEHPRFGLVAATTAIIDVDAGQELLINYGYKDDDAEKSGTHAWYFEQRRKREDEEKQQQLRRQRNEL